MLCHVSVTVQKPSLIRSLYFLILNIYLSYLDQVFIGSCFYILE